MLWGCLNSLQLLGDAGIFQKGANAVAVQISHVMKSRMD